MQRACAGWFVVTITVVGDTVTVRIASVTPRFLDHLTSGRGLADGRDVRRCCRNTRRGEEPDGGSRKHGESRNHRNHDRAHICIFLVSCPAELVLGLRSFGKWPRTGNDRAPPIPISWPCSKASIS